MQGDINVITAKSEDRAHQAFQDKHTTFIGKGGAGKSTVSVNLAVGLVRLRGRDTGRGHPQAEHPKMLR